MPTWLIWTLGLGVPLVAAAVPIIIHLINLTRFRKVDWAAMEFLLRAYQKTRRKLQLESLIMLLLRIAAVILIAAALFPMGCAEIKKWADDSLGLKHGSLNTDAPMHLILILDNSASMGYQQESQTSFDRAKQYALALVDSLEPKRDRVSLIRLSDVYVPPGLGGASVTDDDASKSRQRRIGQVASLNLEAARREISSTTVAAVDTNIVAAFSEAARLAKATPEDDAVGVVVVSDFSMAGWGEVRKDAGGNSEFTQAVADLQKRMDDSGTTMTLYDAGFDNTQNVAITDVRVAERILGNGMEANVFIDIACYATSMKAERRSVRLRYRIDGGTEKSLTSLIELSPGERKANIPLVLTPRELALKPEELKTGASRNVEIFTEQADALKADNSRNLVIHVVPNIPILVINGAPHPEPDKDETFYLETALGISSSRVEGEATGENVRITPNRVVTMKADQLSSIDSFLDYRLVVLANVRDLPEGAAAKLAEFVDAGFGLMIFDGDQLDFQKYNDTLFKDGKGLLPARLGRPAGSDDAGTAPHYHISPQDREHPVIKLFTDTAENTQIITEPEAVHNWRSVQLPQGAEIDPQRPTHVLLNVDAPGGPQPFMLERAYGRGHVVYVTTTASERWNGLWRGNGLPLFLYLELASYLTSSEARYSNLAVGEPYRRVLRITDVAPQYNVRDPSGTTSELVSTADEGLKLLEFGGTAQPGVYAITALDRLEGGETRKKWSERFAVNLEADEANVAKLLPVDTPEGGTEQDVRTRVNAALVEAIGNDDFLFVRAGDELGDGGALGGEEGNREWIWLAVIGVAFLLLETIWSGVISKPED